MLHGVEPNWIIIFVLSNTSGRWPWHFYTCLISVFQIAPLRRLLLMYLTVYYSSIAYLHDLIFILGINIPLSGHHLLLKGFAIVVPILGKSCRCWGISQVLTICQIIQEMLLPSSVIHFFVFASSRSIMVAIESPCI